MGAGDRARRPQHGAFFYFLFLAAYHLPGGVAALVLTVQPMIVLLLGAVLLGARIRLPHIGACALAAAGVALLVLQPQAGLDGVGVLAGLLGAACMALGIVLTRRWGRPEGVALLAFTGWQLTVGGLVLLPVTLLGEPLPERLTWTNVGGFAYLGIIGALLAYVVWFNGIARLPALAASFLSFASPLCATVLGYLFMGQTLGPLQLLAAAGVVGRWCWLNAARGHHRAPHRARPPHRARRPPQPPKAAATATTRNMSTSTAAMMRFLVLGSTLRA